ncbi:MAG: protein kinase [Candidatus Aminicenantes bacterium]|nr:protein kinase [Candidatus Aminicenantes bacterium]
MSKCPSCSGENADTQRFCGECGTPLPPDTHQTQSYPESTKASLGHISELQTGALFANRYQIIEELGTGGMGRVYRVADKTLGEEIALKLIRPEIAEERETLARFKLELKLAREVVHKNVARMFDFNEEGRVPYITMEYVRGENLKRLIRKVGRLFAGQAIPIACQICEGLTEAHRLGIVHRDLKPQNIMIDEDGQAKIMDFGLAQLLKAGERSDGKTTPGTPAYVSPEQIKGLPPDARSDLYSLGVLLYEMLTGTLPFKAASARELFHKHQAEVPLDPRELNPGISAGLSQVVMKCLEKDPAARFQSATEIREALDCLPTSAPRDAKEIVDPISLWNRLAWPAAITVLLALVGYGAYRLFFAGPEAMPATSTIAVLQASGSSPSSSAPGFALELQDALSTKLAGIPGLMVVPELTVNSVDTKGKSSKEIGRLLKADYLLEPSFRIEKPKFFFRAVLINARRDHPARNYELVRDASDVSAVREEFSRDISIILSGDIAEDRLQKSNKGASNNLDARILFHEGMTLIEDVFPVRHSDEVIEEAVKKYQEALALDPEYALALWALGNAYEARFYGSESDPRNPDDLDKMCQYFSEAYRIDYSSAETNIGLGWCHFNRGGFIMAFQCFKNALKYGPDSAVVNLDAGAFLRSIGLYKQALRYLSRAAKLDPSDPNSLVQKSQCFMSLGRFDEAIAEIEKAIGISPGDVTNRYYRLLYLILAKRTADAEKELTDFRENEPDFPFLRQAEALLAAAKGEREKALALKGKFEILTLAGTCFYLRLGMPDEAIANIEAGIDRSFKERGTYLYSYPSLIRNPCLKSLRGNPRFQDILNSQKAQYLKELKKFEDL